MNTNNEATKYNKWIIVLSIFIPLVVAALFGVNLKKLGFDVAPLTILPPIYASINGLTAIILITAVIAIKNKKRTLHENLMKSAIGLSILFLILYIAYHMTSESTKFGDLNHDGILQDTEVLKIGATKYIYYFILITHILLSIVIIPIVLITYVRAMVGNFEKHRKIAKYTFPLWLYVAITGVVVFLMISPYYA